MQPGSGTFLLAFALAGIGSPGAAAAQALDHVTIGTNWLAEGEHGGFYQAVADGTYAAYGLDVEIVPGGPQSANRARFIAGQVDFYSGGSLAQFDAARQGIPTVAVAAIFQKEPQVILAHPERGFTRFEDLASLDTLYLGGEGYDTFFRWMKAAYPGFRDEQYAPYTFSPAPFIADANSGQQGYVTSEPFLIMSAAGWTPTVFLLADAGYNPYATTIETHRDLIERDPDLVQRFVDASIIGWVNYLFGDNAAANALILADNPDMTPDLLAYSVEAMRDYGIVYSGDAVSGGIGCMTDARHQAFYDAMVAAGVVEPGLDVFSVFTTDFVCHGVGLDRIAELSPE